MPGTDYNKVKLDAITAHRSFVFEPEQRRSETRGVVGRTFRHVQNVVDCVSHCCFSALNCEIVRKCLGLTIGDRDLLIRTMSANTRVEIKTWIRKHGCV